MSAIGALVVTLAMLLRLINCRFIIIIITNLVLGQQSCKQQKTVV